MSKRVLSICLAVLIMAMAIPMSIFAPAVSAAQDGEINLSTVSYPATLFEKALNNFDDVSAENLTSPSNNNKYGFAVSNSKGTFTIEKDTETGDGEIKMVANQNKPYNYFYFNATQNNTPTKQTKYLSVHIDFTEITSKSAGTKMTFQTALAIANGSAGSTQNWAQNGVTYYYIPDSTGVVSAVTTASGTSSDVTLYGYAGEAGTFIIPVEMWSGTVGTNGIGKDISLILGGAVATGTSYNQSHILVIPQNIANGDVIYYDDFEWHLANPLVKYNTALEIENFEDTELDSATGYWANKMTTTPSITENGRFAVKSDTVEENGAYHTFQVKNVNAWPKNAKAFAFDVDFSEITEHNIRTALRFYNPDYSNTTEKVFMPANGEIYAYGADGALSTLEIGEKADANYCLDVGLPIGFKGTIVVPVESMRRADDKANFSDALYDLDGVYAEIEVRGYGAGETVSSADGKSVYFDNFNFYVEPEAPEAGTTFSSTVNPSMNIEEYITEAVKTTEVWVKSTSGGAILNKKFHSTGAAYYTYNLSVGVNAAGNPYYNISDGNGGKNYGYGHEATCTFTDVNVNTGEWTHLAFVQKAESIDLYVNSALAGSVAVADFDVIVNGKLTVGHTFNNEVTSKSNYFGGEIANLRLWNDVRTPAELYYNAVETPADTTGLIAGWNLNGETPFADISGKGNDIVAYDYEISADDALYAELDKGAAEGEYSFVFLPDTQIVNYHYSDQFPKVYDWVLENQDKYNIKAVMSLGDITDKNDDALDANGDGVVTREEAPSGEWARARAQFDRLTAAGIPWTIIPGNHDCKGASVGPRNYANLNQFFPLSEISQFAHFGGSFTNSSVVNSYYYLNVGNVKYLLLCLDQEPKANAIEWANQIVAAHPDYRVIVTTHIYMTAQGVYYVPKGSTEPYNQPGSYTGFDTYESLWNGFLAKHANIDMVVCGHSSTPNILTRTDKGVNGNDVLQVIVDTQQIDYTYASASCVAVATFSADGNDVRFRLYSTAQEMFLDEDSQFETKLEATVGEPIVETSKASDIFNEPKVLRDFTTFDLTGSSNSSSQIGLGKAVNNQTAVSPTTLKDVSIVNRQLHIAPCITYGETSGQDGRIDVAFKALPNAIKGEGYNAVAIHIDLSKYTPHNAPYVRLVYGGYSTAHKDAVIYTLSDSGELNKIVSGSTWGIAIPDQFKGYIIFPFDNSFSGTVTTAADFEKETQSNNSEFKLYFMENRSDTTLILDNLCYLKNFDPNFIGTTEDTKPTNNVVLTDEITVNYKLDAADLETKGYTPTRAEFEVNGVVTNVDEFAVEDGKYVFAFNGVNPKNIADNITVTYFATKNGDTSGTEYSAYKQNYSVKEYCDNILANYTGDDAEQVKSVIKGMLNFSAASQEYFGYNEDSLVNVGYEDYTAKRDYTSAMKLTANEGTSTVKWKSAGLNFSSNVALRFNIEAADIEGLVVKAVVGDNTWFIPATAFSKVDGIDNRYYVYFNKLSVACMSDVVDFTVYDANGVQVSDTLTYSIESYAAAKYKSEGAIANLVKTMMNYGDAAKALNGAAAQ